jgi:hypothetical protein
MSTTSKAVAKAGLVGFQPDGDEKQTQVLVGKPERKKPQGKHTL